MESHALYYALRRLECFVVTAFLRSVVFNRIWVVVVVIVLSGTLQFSHV